MFLNSLCQHGLWSRRGRSSLECAASEIRDKAERKGKEGDSVGKEGRYGPGLREGQVAR